jgi:hypothetical protein
MRRLLPALLSACLAAGAVATVWFVLVHLDYKQRTAAEARAQLLELTQTRAGEIDRLLRATMAATDALAADFTEGRVGRNEAELRARLAGFLGANPRLHGASAAFAAHAFAPDRRLYAPYLYRKDGGLELVRLEELSDYVGGSQEWYSGAFEQGSHWSSPYLDEAGETLMTTYSSRFSGPGSGGEGAVPGTAQGVVTADLSMDEVKRMVESLDLGVGGFGAVTSKDGVYLYHPRSDYVLARRTLLDLAEEHGDEELRRLAERLLAGEQPKGLIDRVGATTGERAWLVIAPVEATGWSLQVTYLLSDLGLDTDTLRRQLMRITLAATVGLAALTLLVLRVDRAEPGRLWLASIATSLLAVGAIGALWHLSLAYGHVDAASGIRLLSRETLSQLQKRQTERARQLKQAPPLFVPTGLLLDWARLTADGWQTAGTLWQRYGPEVPEALRSSPVVSPSEGFALTELARHRGNDGTEVVRWSFQASIPQHLDHASYPLDRTRLYIDLECPQVGTELIFVPDLAAYPLTNPTARPGLEESFHLRGWRLLRSFFAWVRLPAGADPLPERTIVREPPPTLRFSFDVQRSVLDASLSSLLPLLVVAMLLFSVLVCSNLPPEASSKLGTSTALSLEMCAALCFVVVFSHLDLRQKIVADEIVYLEYFYFILYLAILMVVATSILAAMGVGPRLLRRGHNLVAKLAFWPLTAALILLASLWKLY